MWRRRPDIEKLSSVIALALFVFLVGCATNNDRRERMRAQQASFRRNDDEAALRRCVLNQSTTTIEAAEAACSSELRDYTHAVAEYFRLSQPDVSLPNQGLAVQDAVSKSMIVIREAAAQRILQSEQARAVAENEAKEARAIAENQAKARREWAKTLIYPGTGGWEYVATTAENDWILFASRRLALRSGSIIALWTRTEYRDPQSASGARTTYLSVVMRYQFDCAKAALKVVNTGYYPQRNMEGDASGENRDEAKVLWEPIVPGTQAEHWLTWACKNIQRSTSEKSN